MTDFKENKKAESSPAREAEENEQADASSGDSHCHGNPLFQAGSGAEATWKTVPARCQQSKERKYDPVNDRSQRGGRGQPHNSRDGRSRGRGRGRGSFNPSDSLNKGPEKYPYVEGRGRTGRNQRGRGFDSRSRRPRGSGIPNHQSDHGFTLKGVKYERNKLYVLGLHYKTTKDCVLNFIARISGYDVKHVLMFKPNGRAIVTLDTDKIRDFDEIREEAAKPKNKLEYVNVVIERAPVCKSIFVGGIPENTSQKEVVKYFNKFGVVEKFVTNTEEVKAQRMKEKRAIVYFKHERSVKEVVEKDQFLDADTLLHVERYYPFMGTVEPVDSKTFRHPHNAIPVSDLPYFRMDVDVDIIEFVMGKCNQELVLKEQLFHERAQINLTNRDGYVLVKYNPKGQKPDDEFDEDAWENRCREIINDVLDRFTMKEFPVEKEIWEETINQLPQIELLFPNFSAQVKKFEDLKELKLVCSKKDLPRFEEKLLIRLKKIEQTELEKTLDHKTLTNRPNEILRLLQIVDIQDVLKNDVHQDVQVNIDLSKKSIFLKTPEGQMSSAMAYLDKRVEEIEQNSLPNPPAEIIEILKTKVGKRKLNAELKEANIRCGFNVDEKNKRILFLGRTPSDTLKGRKVAETVLVTGRLHIKDRDNDFLLSDEWKQLCRDFEKRLKVRCQRRLMEFHVIGLKKDVDEVVKEMRKCLNEKNAKEGEFRFDSLVSQRFFHEYYNDEIKNLEESLSTYSVKIAHDENGDLLFSGTVEGVKKVTEKLNALQDDIKEKTVKVTLPGMRSFLAKDEGKLIGTVEKEHRCIIEIEETTGERKDQEEDSDEVSSLSSDEEADVNEDDNTIGTPEGKKIIWKLGNIEEEEADILVCSVGSSLNLSIGAIARAMSQAAGPKLQDALELIKATKSHLRQGEVVYTIAGNLPCNHVVFCVCCPWNDGKGDAKQILQTLLWNCFDKASELGSGSIALPLIGTGNLNFPHDVAVQVMVDEALSYSSKCPNSSIEEFRFIVHSEDQEGISSFQDVFGNLKEENQRRCPVPGRPLTGQANHRRKKMELDQASGFTEGEDDGEGIAVALPFMSYQHKVTVYGHQQDIEEAIEALKNGVIKECHSTEVTDDVISRLPKYCKRDLRQKAREEDVGLDFSKHGAIILKGFPINVTTMHTEVSKVLQNQLKEEHKMERAEMTAGNVQWCYLNVTRKQEPFEKMANYDIETAYQSKTPSVSFMHKNMQAEIIFDLEKVKFLKTGAKKSVFRKEVVPLPQEWDLHPLDAKGRKERVHLVRLEIDSPEYQFVQDKFMQSFKRDREVSIASIQRVQNPSMYRSYVTKKQSMDEKNGNHRNEWYLFHGTAYQNVKDINAHGFNRSFSGRNAATYGDGVYFATDASYSSAFSNQANAKGEYCMYLAKVLVGKFALGKEDIKTPPPIDPDRRELLYDSVVNSTDYPSVFVVFHDDQCYPEYLITFSKPEKR